MCARRNGRRGRGAAAAALLLALAADAAAAELPRGFGDISVGDPWSGIESRHEFRALSDVSSAWDQYVHDCGYREVVLEAENGRLMVTVNDFVVTELTFVTAIRPGSDLLAAADEVMQTYGQPDSASMRDLVGAVTIDRDRVNYVTLHYSEPREVRVSLSGEDLWQYQVSVRLAQHRWHENKTLQCARARERAAQAQPAQ